MKTMIALAVLVMATGCAQMMERKGYVKNEYGEWIKPGTRYFGDSPGEQAPAWVKGGGTWRNPHPMPNLIQTPAIEPFGARNTPVVVTTGDAPVTMVTPDAFGGSTIVNLGGSFYRPRVAPYPYYGY